MHIPDGFLDLPTATGAAVLAAGGVAVALRETRRRLEPRQVPLMALTAAFVFVAQMLNFPVAAGTSGHLIGAALATALVGPAAAVLVLTTVVVVQCLVFADGGLLALGANLLNMAILAPVAAWAAGLPLRRALPGLAGRLAGATFGGWVAVVLAAAACAGELALAGAAPWRTVAPAMIGVHLLIGAGEGVITALVLAAIARARPELVTAAGAGSGRRFLRTGVLAALALALFAAPFASSLPDGLEAVAERLGFAALEQPAALPAPVPDYALPGLTSPLAATAAAGVLGALGMLGVALLLGRALARTREAGSA